MKGRKKIPAEFQRNLDFRISVNNNEKLKLKDLIYECKKKMNTKSNVEVIEKALEFYINNYIEPKPEPKKPRTIYTRRQREKGSGIYTKEILIKKVQELAKDIDRVPTIKDCFFYRSATRKFGSWENFLKESGLI